MAALVAVSTILFPATSDAATQTDGVSLFSPALGCRPTETQVGTTDLLARVRTDSAKTHAPRRGSAKAPLREQRGPQQAARPSASHPRHARKIPRAEQEPRAVVLRSFYTCDAAPRPNLTEGTGWRLVGPLRRS